MMTRFVRQLGNKIVKNDDKFMQADDEHVVGSSFMPRKMWSGKWKV